MSAPIAPLGRGRPPTVGPSIPCNARRCWADSSDGVGSPARAMAERILIADDDEDSRTGLAALLAEWGYEVADAADGRDAVDRALAFRPSVIISDLVMPGMDGLALLEVLHAELPATSVIVLTGHATIETAVSAM